VGRCEAAELRPITVHDARHTCATLLVDLDVHPRVIMRILRHADQAVTMEIAANASSAATRGAAAWLEPALRSAAVLCCCTHSLKMPVEI
jgi:integrase